MEENLELREVLFQGPIVEMSDKKGVDVNKSTEQTLPLWSRRKNMHLYRALSTQPL